MRALIPGIWILASFLHPAIAQDELDVADVLKKVAETRANLRQYTFTATMHSHDDADERLDLSGSILVAIQKPSKARWEVNGTITRILTGAGYDFQAIVNGHDAWMYRPNLNRYERLRPDSPDWASGPQLIEHLEFLFLTRSFQDMLEHTRFIREETIPFNGAPADCVVLEFRHGSTDFYRWWIDKTTYLMLREDVEGQDYRNWDHPALSTRFITFQINHPVDPKVFTFSPPPGARRVNKLDQ